MGPNLAEQLSIWRECDISPLLPESENYHSTHSYFNACPESPDGKHVLFFQSYQPDAHFGDICILNRMTGSYVVLARDITTEDAHRGACQQWCGGGSHVAFHDYRAGKWSVHCVDVSSGELKNLADNRQIGFGSPYSCEVPVYGCHWNPGEHTGLAMIGVHSGEIRNAVTQRSLLDQYGAWIDDNFEDRNVSVFFPVVSPDGKKVFFKIARGRGGDDFKGMDASFRIGKVVFDLVARKFICLLEEWGHPSWSGDSMSILEKGNLLYSLATGTTQTLAEVAPGMVPTPSDHPSLSPDGVFFVTDGRVLSETGEKLKQKGIFVAEAKPDGTYITLTEFMDDGGADSWRPVHPHPIFSLDGKRIYFNRSTGKFSRIYVASRS